MKGSMLTRLFAGPDLRKMLSVLFFAVLIGAVCLMPAFASEPAPASGAFTIDKKELDEALKHPWNIEAERLSYDEQAEVFEAEGSVRISSMDRLIEARRAVLDMRKRRAELWGNVSIQYGRNWMKGEHVIWNLDSETGWVDNGVVFFAENNFFVQGRSISKSGPTQFQLQDGFLTSCNPSDPDWKVQYREMKVDSAGNAWAKGVSMWAGGMPFAYLPIMGVPVEKHRQSGFLLPWAGYSDLTGVDFEIPYYLVIREDMDATFYARYMTERGFMGGGEFRMNNRQWGEGVWAFNVLADEASKSFLADKEYPYQADERFWARGRHNIKLPWQIDGKIDLDIVSDKNFLQEFSNGSSSFFTSEVGFRDRFGRGILYDSTSLVRESTAYLEKRGESTLLSFDTRYFQQLNDSLEATTVQRLPSMSFSVLPKWLNDSSFYYTMDSSAVNYFRREGDREQRLNFQPRVYLPLHWKNYLDVEPSFGFGSTSYFAEWDDSSFNTFNQRAVSDIRVDMSTRINRVFPVQFGNVVAFQHAIRPEVSYEYATQAVHGHIPQLDRLDRDQSRNGVRYGFSTFLMAKETSTDQRGNPVTLYREWARLRAFQFFNVETPLVEDPLFNTQVMSGGLSPVGLRLDLMPKKYLTLSYDADFDMEATGEGTSHDLYFTLDSGKGHILRVDYQRREDQPVNEIMTEVLLKTVSNLYLNTYHDYSLHQGELFKHGYGFRYYRGCWGIGVTYEREGKDNRVFVSLDLLGLGSLGQNKTPGMSVRTASGMDFQRPESYRLAQ